jgi:hypothetical protein
MLKFGSLTNESLIGDFSWDQLKSINGELTTGFLESVNAAPNNGYKLLLPVYVETETDPISET